MRTCIRCGIEMKENCGIKVQRAGYGLVLTKDARKLFGGRMAEPAVAICPQCGEVSFYLEDVSLLNNK